MNITSSLVSRRIAFTLPEEILFAVSEFDFACSVSLGHPTLESVFDGIDGVSLVTRPNAGGVDVDRPISVDIGAEAADDSEDLARAAIVEYAEAAVTVSTLAPTLLDPDSKDWDVGDDLLFIGDNFILTSSTDRVISIHYLRNGANARLDLNEAGAFDLIAGQSYLAASEWVYSKLPHLGKSTSSSDDDDLMAGHPLERLVPVGRFGTKGSKAVYMDHDLVIVADRSGTVTVHFCRDGFYALKQIKGEAAQELLAVTSIRGLDLYDDVNPVRSWVRQLFDFDVAPPFEAGHDELPELSYNC
jgi:hypothetical protein